MAPAALIATGDVPERAPPLVVVAHVAQVIFPVAVVMASGEDAVTAGVPDDEPSVIVGVPAAEGTVIVAFPLLVPTMDSAPVAPDVPTVNVLPEKVMLALPVTVV